MYLPMILEVIGALAVVVAVGVIASPWVALAIGGGLTIATGYLLEARSAPESAPKAPNEGVIQ